MVRFRAQICAAVASAVVCGCAERRPYTKPNLVNDIPPAAETGVVTGALPRVGLSAHRGRAEVRLPEAHRH